MNSDHRRRTTSDAEVDRPARDAVSLYGMRVRVVPTRHRGVARAPREIARADGIVGELLLTEHRDELLRRTTRVATLTGIGDAKSAELLPALYDATVV